MFIFLICCFVLAFINGCLHGWKLMLVLDSIIPLVIIATIIIKRLETIKTKDDQNTAENSAQDALGAIQIVKAFDGQVYEVKR